MSLATASSPNRGQRSPFSASLLQEFANQQVPGSPLSPLLFATHLASAGTAATTRPGVVYSPSSGSPLAQVPEGGSPLLRHLLACRKRQRDTTTPSPSPASKRSSRDSPRVPNSIIIVKRTARPHIPSKTADEQIVPNIPTPELKGSSDHTAALGGLRKLPEVMDNTKLLDLFGESNEIFASSREE